MILRRSYHQNNNLLVCDAHTCYIQNASKCIIQSVKDYVQEAYKTERDQLSVAIKNTPPGPP